MLGSPRFELRSLARTSTPKYVLHYLSLPPFASTLPSPTSTFRPSDVELTSVLGLEQVDGVTRTLAKLLEHLQSEGHEALLLGPESGMVGSLLLGAGMEGVADF